MIQDSSGTLQQVGVHEGSDPEHQRGWVGLAEKRKREGSPRMICDGNGGWGQGR